MNINWGKVNALFEKANELHKAAREIYDLGEKSSSGDVWQFSFSNLPWRVRLKTSWYFLKASVGVLFLGKAELKLRKR